MIKLHLFNSQQRQKSLLGEIRKSEKSPAVRKQGSEPEADPPPMLSGWGCGTRSGLSPVPDAAEKPDSSTFRQFLCEAYLSFEIPNFYW